MAGLAAAAPATSEQVLADKLDRLQSEMTPLAEELPPLVEKLKAMKGSYAFERDRLAAKPEHDKLVSEILPRYQRLSDLHAEFKDSRDGYEAMALLAAGRGLGSPGPAKKGGSKDLLKGRKAQAGDVGAHLLNANRLQRFSAQIQAVREDAGNALKADHEARTAAESEAAERERLLRRLSMAGLAALALTGLGLLAWRIALRL